MHVALELFSRQNVELLLVRHRAQGRNRQRLGLAAGEQARAVSTRQHADLNRDVAHVLQAAPVDANALFDDPLADPVLERLVEQLAEDLDVLWETFAELEDGLA